MSHPSDIPLPEILFNTVSSGHGRRLLGGSILLLKKIQLPARVKVHKNKKI
jgi:hypothetical protein